MAAWLLLLLAVVGRGLAWELTLLHVNDIHVRMEETNKYSAACRLVTRHGQKKNLPFASKFLDSTFNPYRRI
jgi:hypothetical protein